MTKSPTHLLEISAKSRNSRYKPKFYPALFYKLSHKAKLRKYLQHSTSQVLIAWPSGLFYLSGGKENSSGPVSEGPTRHNVLLVLRQRFVYVITENYFGNYDKGTVVVRKRRVAGLDGGKGPKTLKRIYIYYL